MSDKWAVIFQTRYNSLFKLLKNAKKDVIAVKIPANDNYLDYRYTDFN